ncbi:Gfo/Idh/MocA family oxidoreductase [Luteitalea sp.]|uniref:Gfo/Idh/MocA family protein n=1 Tax=Luteitalea sp. TaxID=2004800 RepID=UPI000A697729|nr:Gfo/Idh/MocA family oxidoreductase [Luteitalea sp.]
MTQPSALTSLNAPGVHGAQGNTIQIALIGCGGRGSGAVVDALSSPENGPLTLVAMADIFPNRLASSHAALSGKFPGAIAVPEDQRFLGFDGYKKAMDCLRPGDIAIFATPPAFRWVHFEYAISKGLNVFMEKPVTVDGPTTRRMFALADASVKKNLKVGVGLMCRHCDARRELQRRVRDGQIGEIVSMRAYRMQRPGGNVFVKPDPTMPEVMFQLRRFHAFLWASGGVFSDYNIHNIDECCMIKDAWPVKAHAVGARHYRGDHVDQNLDVYSVEYTFPDGTRLHFDGRNLENAYGEFASYAHGTKGLAVISTNRHTPARCRIYDGQVMDDTRLAWAYPPEERSPYRVEWVYLIDAIRNDRPWNEVRRGAQVSLITSMGRMAAHTGRIVTYDEILNSSHEFAPGVDALTAEGPAPLLAGPDGRYPVPNPGLVTEREY